MDRFATIASKAFPAALAAIMLGGCAGCRSPERPVLEPVGEFLLPPDAPEGLSDIAWLGGDSYAFVEDSGGRIHFARIGIDSSTGAITNCIFEAVVSIPEISDGEGLAYDPSTATLYVSDESGPAIYSFPHGHTAGHGSADKVATPDFFAKARPNKSLEALGFELFCPGPNLLWAANEDALDCDGAPSSADNAALVRIAAFAPEASSAATCKWWFYRMDRAEGKSVPGMAGQVPFNGVAALLALGDGRLLVLERNCGLTMPEDGEGPHNLISCGIYFVDVLGTRPGSTVEKELLWGMRFPTSNYEGMTLGPTLDDGSSPLILVADGDISTATVFGREFSMQWRKALFSLKLRYPDGAAPGNR